MNEPTLQRIADTLLRLGALVRERSQLDPGTPPLSPLQARTLTALWNGDGQRVGQLARELRVSPGTLSASITTLEGKGLLSKSKDEDEHRAVLVRLTPAGRRRAQRVRARTNETLGTAVEALSDRQAGDLLASLLTLLHSFERQGQIPTTQMCYSCQYFVPHGGRGNRPHHCELLGTAIGHHELQSDCPDHQAAGPQQRQRTWSRLQTARSTRPRS